MGKFTVQRIKAGFKFNLKAGNGQIIASSGVYYNVEDCLAAIERVKQCAFAPVEDQTLSSATPLPFPKFEVQHTGRGGISFFLRDGEGVILAHGKGYTAKRSCFAGIRSLGENAPDAPVITG